MKRTAWYVSPRVTIGGVDYCGETSSTAFEAGLVGFLDRAGQLAAGQKEITIIVDVDAWRAFRHAGIWSPALSGGIAAELAAAGWKVGNPLWWQQPWQQYWGEGRPTVHLGRLDLIEADVMKDPGLMPILGDAGPDMVAALQHWHDLTGVAWQAYTPVMGLSVMVANLARYRVGRGEYLQPVRRDENTPRGAGERVWTPQAWANHTPDGAWLDGWDKHRAGLVAAGVAKLAPAGLEHTGKWRTFDPHRAGWWCVNKPPWNMPGLPHPYGPAGKVDSIIWVSTPTMDLGREVARLGWIDIPDVYESWTAPARQVLAGWYAKLESAYEQPAGGTYQDRHRGLVQAAAKEAGTRAIGMLNRSTSSVYRSDWYHGVNATKRANMWRTALKISQASQRWPVAVDDDCLWYASDTPEPMPPALLTLASGQPWLSDVPGGYHHQERKPREKP